MKASEIMTKSVISVDGSTTVSEAAKIMAEHDIGALIIQTPKPTFGIFTQGDLLNRVIAKNKSLRKTKIADVMTESTKCAQSEDNLSEITTIMYEENVKYLPVMEGRKLVGIISHIDLFRAVFRGAEGYKQEVI